jgi:hypothetical protein
LKSSPTDLPQEDPEHFPLLILENCQIVDVLLGEISSNHHVIISLDGKIFSMGPAPFIPSIKSWMRYDCQNMFLLPGLCDAHTNIAVPYDPSPSLPRSSASYLALSSSHILKSLLHSGVDSQPFEIVEELMLVSFKQSLRISSMLLVSYPVVWPLDPEEPSKTRHVMILLI